VEGQPQRNVDPNISSLDSRIVFSFNNLCIQDGNRYHGLQGLSYGLRGPRTEGKPLHIREINGDWIEFFEPCASRGIDDWSIRARATRGKVSPCAHISLEGDSVLSANLAPIVMPGSRIRPCRPTSDKFGSPMA